jgi:ankyrin repeat protein
MLLSIRVYQHLFVFIFTCGLISCSLKPKSNAIQGMSGSECFQFASKNKIQEFNNKKSDCLRHRSDNGSTPLMLAAANGQIEMMDYLLAQGVDINEKDNQGDTALNYVVSRNQLEAARFLISRGARVVSQRDDGISSLMQALQMGTPDMALTLMADVEALNQFADDGWTPIYFSIRRQDLGLLTALINRGACVNIFDSYQQTPLDFAREVKWTEGEKIIAKSKPCRGTP